MTEFWIPNENVMADQIVITEKSSQAKDVRAAIGSRYGMVLPAEGHLIDLLEPEDVVPEWKRWSPVLLRPEGLYGTRPAKGGNKATKLKAIREALRTAKRVWLATDCDREGQLIGQEILEHCKYRGQVMRVLFMAQDAQTIRQSFDRAKLNSEYARLYAAAVARRQADQIYNLSLTRTATVILGKGARGVIGVGRVKTPTLAIVCRRELEIRNFVPVTYFEIVATAMVDGGAFKMRHAPQDRILKREIAEAVVSAAQNFEGPLSVRVEDKRQRPPKLHDLPSLQKLCASRFGWTAAKTLEIAQELYDGKGKKIITYPRAEVRYLPENLIADVPQIVAGLQVGKSFSTIPVPAQPIIRKGKSGSFHDKGLEGASHHAVIPNVNTIESLREVWPRLSSDEKKLFDVIARAYLASVMPDFRYCQTTATLDVGGFPFKATGRQHIDLGWRAAFPEWQPADEKSDDAQVLPQMRNGETARLRNPAIEDKETRPPPRYDEGTLIDAMQQAWRFVDDGVLRERLKEAKGIGTPATRAEIIDGLKRQGFLIVQGKNIVPTETGLNLFGVLQQADPALVDPGVTAQLECLLDDVVVGKQETRSSCYGCGCHAVPSIARQGHAQHGPERVRGLPEPGLATRRVLLGLEPKRHAKGVRIARRGKIATAFEGGQVWGKRLDRKRRDRAHARHGLCAAHHFGFLGGTSHLRVELCNTRIQPLDLLQIHLTKFPHLGVQPRVIICNCARERLEMSRPPGRDQSMFGEVPKRHAKGVPIARRIDHLGALADEHLPRAK
ncbi:hypothetical protein P775_28735, partial [Puniceibacterium antarcticum]